MVKLEQLGLHANSVNLARRWSVQNEPDLLMENMYEDDGMSPRRNDYSRQECANIAKHLSHYKHLPMECSQFRDVALDLKRRDSDTTHGSAFLS